MMMGGEGGEGGDGHTAHAVGGEGGGTRDCAKQVAAADAPLYMAAIVGAAAAAEPRLHPDAAHTLVQVTQHDVAAVAAPPYFMHPLLQRVCCKTGCGGGASVKEGGERGGRGAGAATCKALGDAAAAAAGVDTLETKGARVTRQARERGRERGCWQGEGRTRLNKFMRRLGANTAAAAKPSTWPSASAATAKAQAAGS